MNTGSCLCGAVRWRMEGPYARMTNCHCSMCRKAHGAPFATYIRTDTDKFEVLSGAESVTVYEASDNFKRRFCAHCGSVLWIGEGDQIGVAAGIIENGRADQPVMDNDIGVLKPLQRFQGQQVRIARPGADNRDLPVRGRLLECLDGDAGAAAAPSEKIALPEAQSFYRIGDVLTDIYAKRPRGFSQPPEIGGQQCLDRRPYIAGQNRRRAA
ncbi:MAG: GFA family protein [Rhodospirillaceae bacterium]|nr:GFA family protein [Rhodospirillaceae bacterium]